MAVIESAGLKWHVDFAEQDFIGPEPDHEPLLTTAVLAELPPGGAFLDVGAHVGHYSLRAAKKASKVYAVEPVPETAQRLRENARLNHLNNVHVLEIAAWNGTARFTIDCPHSQYRRGASCRMVPAEKGPVWGARLDDALNQFPLRPDRLDVVKVDTEGADLEVLDGMRGLLARHRPVMFVEDHSVHGYYQQGQLLDRIVSVGYKADPFEAGEVAYWKCVPACES